MEVAPRALRKRADLEDIDGSLWAVKIGSGHSQNGTQYIPPHGGNLTFTTVDIFGALSLLESNALFTLPVLRAFYALPLFFPLPPTQR